MKLFGTIILSFLCSGFAGSTWAVDDVSVESSSDDAVQMATQDLEEEYLENELLNVETASLEPLGNSLGYARPMFLELPSLGATQFEEGNFRTFEGQATHELGFGGLRYDLGLDVASYYDDNINISNVNRLEDFVFEIAPRFEVTTAQYEEGFRGLSLIYQPTYNAYVDNSDKNGLDQFVFLQGYHNWGKLTVGLQQKYNHLTGTVLDFGNFVDRDIYTTRLMSLYEITGKLSAELNLGQKVRVYDSSSGVDSYLWNVQAWLNYELTPKVSLGVGPNFGWLDVVGSPNQTFQQFLTRVIYEATGKLTLTNVLGAEYRQFQSGGVGDRWAPILEFGGIYAATEKLEFQLRAFSGVQNSGALRGRNYELSGFQLGGQHEITKYLFASLNGGYEVADFYSTVPTIANNRTDDYFYIQPSLIYRSKHLQVKVFYRYRDNQSTRTARTFTNNQAGVEVGLDF